MIQRLHEILSSSVARVSAVLAMLLSMAVFLAPADSWKPDWPSAAAFLTALGVWIWAELGSAAVKHPHDVRLMERILATLSENERSLLRTMEMSEDFKWTDFAGVDEIARWDGVDFEFVDTDLEKRWAPLKIEIRSLRTELARRSLPKPPHNGWYSVKEGAKRDRWEDDALFLNNATDALTLQLETFIRFARRRLAI